jgi:3-oxoacyl-[acyl-carrier protein] reductase
MNTGLTGLRVIVSGASRGIGKVIAETFLKEGASVALSARGESALAATAKELSEFGTVFFRATDASDTAAVNQFVAETAEALGGVDIVVANASAGSVRGPESWQANFDADLMGVVNLISGSRKLLGASSAASVVTVGSTSTMEAGVLPTADSYGALKAAATQHTLAQARALAPKGIRVNVVSPGPVLFPDGTWDQLQSTMPEFYEQTLASHGLGKYATPQDVASAVVFLASPLAGHITGANLVVDGGFTSRFGY